MKSLANTIYSCFKDKGEFSLKDAYSENSDKPKETVRARIYDNLGVKFERVAKGLYRTIEGDESCVVIEGDGRDLSMLGDASIDCILTDHPWLDKKSNKGGDRNFATYDCFRYTLDDFREKPACSRTAASSSKSSLPKTRTTTTTSTKSRNTLNSAGCSTTRKSPGKRETLSAIPGASPRTPKT